MESQSETTQTVSALKLPILKTGDYDLRSMRMEKYLTHTDYALWEVIVNGDAPAIASASTSTKGPIPPKTAEQKLARKNELKAKSTLLLAIPDEYLLKFYGIKDAKTLWEAIKASNGELEPTPGVNRLLLMKHGSKIALADESIEMNEVESVGELGVNNLDRFPTRDELAYHRNEEDKQRGVEYVKNKVAEFYTRRLELGPEYEDGVEDHLEAKEVAM
ncbi:hypothetical protein Tco_0007909 [Tanacetum coccineum]